LSYQINNSRFVRVLFIYAIPKRQRVTKTAGTWVNIIVTRGLVNVGTWDESRRRHAQNSDRRRGACHRANW
jgi:hypothetical protein